MTVFYQGLFIEQLLCGTVAVFGWWKVSKMSEAGLLSSSEEPRIWPCIKRVLTVCHVPIYLSGEAFRLPSPEFAF